MFEALEGRRLLSSIASLTLRNATTNTPIGSLTNGMTVDLARYPKGTKFNIQATTSPTSVGSVLFVEDSFRHTENLSPYRAFGDNGEFRPGNEFAVGSHTLMVTPYSRSGLGGTAGTATKITFRVINSTTPSPTPTPTPAPAPAPTEPPAAMPATFSGPIKITAGGTYTGNWESTDPYTPAVTIATDQPVTIVNSFIRGKGKLIQVTAKANVTVKNVKGYAVNPNVYGRATGYFLNADYGVNSVTVEGCYMEGTRGIYLDALGGSPTKIRIWGNRALNIDGRHSNGAGGWISTNGDSDYEIANFAQFQNMPSVGSGEIAFNQVKNEKGKSRVEDVINMYKSSGTSTNPIRIHDNFIDGAYKASPTTSDSNGYAGGGILADNGSNYISIMNNQVLNTTNYGVAIGAGHGNVLSGNRVMSDEMLPDTNVGIYVWNQYDPSAWFGNSATNNLADWVNGNDFWNPSSSTWSGNSHSEMTSAGEYASWAAKLSANGVVLP